MAANVTLSYPQHLIGRARPHKVYVRPHWFAPWQQVPWLFADSLTWSLPPTIGQATLHWDFGRGMRQGENVVAQVARLAERNRYFVKVEFDLTDLAANAYLRWWGTIELQGQADLALLKRGGANIPSGRMPLVAFSLESLLYRTPIRKSVWRDNTSGAERTADRVYAFNPQGPDNKAIGNRSAAPGMFSYLFSSVVGEPDEDWSTRDAVEYLIAHHRPLGVFDIPFPAMRLEAASDYLLPDWDNPSVECENKMLGELLDTLMPAGRGLGWRLVVDQESDPTDIAPDVLLRPVSHLGEPLVLPSGTLQPNPRRLAILADGNPDWHVSFKDSSARRFDQVRVRGAVRSTTCTLSDADNSIEDGWTSAHETAYEAGFSADGGYAALDTAEKQRRNAQARGRDELLGVYRRFAIPAAWDQTVKDGLGGGGAQCVFPLYAPGSIKFPVCPRELRVLPTIPLLEGWNYEDLGDPAYDLTPTPPVRESGGPHERLPPLVLFKIPHSDDDAADPRYIQIEKVGLSMAIGPADADEEWALSGRVEVPESDRAVLVHVQGKPQHAIAFLDFAPLAVDEAVGEWDWHDALFTVALSDDRYCEGIYPADVDAMADVIGCRRELLLEAGDRYRLDWVVPGTVIAVATNGDLVRCVAGGWVHDDRAQLESRAKLAYEFYGQTRRSVQVATASIDSRREILLGDYLETIGTADAQTIGTVITEITLTIPDGEASPTIAYTTNYAELEPVLFTS